MAMSWFIPLDWYDYVLLGIVVLIPALLLWRAWAVKRQEYLEKSFERLIVMTLVGWLAWFLATVPFSMLFMACCSDFPYKPLKLVMTRWLYHNTLGSIFTLNFWAVPLFLFVVGLAGFALAKFRLDIAIIPLGLVSFIALVVFAATGGTLASVVPDAKGVPQYPGSEDGLLAWGGMSFVAPAGQDDVWSFYERELPNGGWKLLRGQRSPYYLVFERTEMGKELSSRFLLLMNSSTTGEESKKTQVSLQIYKLPEMQKLPVYPGAHDVKTMEEHLQDDGVQRTTTYMVSAQPKEVEAWYRSILSDNTSWNDETEMAHVREGLLFRFHHNGTSSTIKPCEIVVIARQASGGQTQVEVRGVEYPFRSSYFNT